jgi:hypothetical protein
MIDRNAFYADQQVADFTQWLAQHADGLSINLNFKSTKFVPGGLCVQVIGLPQALDSYIWKSEGTDAGNWIQTAALLAQFRIALRAAMAANDDEAAFSASDKIIKWGGDRNPKVGAIPFLRKLAQSKGLVSYLANASDSFALDTATLEGKLSVLKMNSMLTKVHALASIDGLPIYDSRVAAAIASLVEMWRCAHSRTAETLPPALAFPATLANRTVRDFHEAAAAPGLIYYSQANEARTARSWSEAKIRLGWVMQKVLALRPELFAGVAGTDVQRMHALEASLFMVGYDVACLKKIH